MKEKTAFIILVTVFILIIIAVTVLSFIHIQLAPVYSLMLNSTLIAVTALYVYLTARIVKAANRQAEIMLNAEYDAAKPIIRIEVEGRGQLKVTCENIGKGPALNLRCWIDDREYPQLWEHKIFSIAVAVGEPYVGFISADVHTGIKDYMLRVGFLIAQYESIFKKTYESSLILSTDADPQLTFREVEGNSMVKSSPSSTPDGDETQLDRIEKSIKRIPLGNWRLFSLSIGLATLFFSVSGLAVEWWVRWTLAGIGLIFVILASWYK